MKVGLITTHFAVNYGAILQAYALRKSIEKITGHCEIIDYFKEDKVGGRKFAYSWDSSKGILKSIFLLLSFKYRKQVKTKRLNFDNFLRDKCNLSSKRYGSFEELKMNLEQYDVFFCGSDQIWNLNLSIEKAFFLPFKTKYPNSKFISYAPSIAENLDSYQEQILKKFIDHFDAISIREEDGQKIVQKLYPDRKISWVLDPVFLLSKDEWTSITPPHEVKEPYIFLYGVGSNDEYLKIIQKLRQGYPDHKLVCINLHQFNKYKADVIFNDASPQMFLSLLKNASLICSSSFHALVFSIIFNKQFLIVPDPKRSSRHTSILKIFGLEKQICFDSNKYKGVPFINKSDYQEVNKILEEYKKRSINYIKESLCLI